VRRSGGRRLSATHILISVVVILAFVLNLLVLQDRSATTLVAVADRHLVAGSVFSPGAVRLVPVDSGFEGISTLITEDDLSGFEGWVVQRSIPSNGLVDVSALVEPGSPSGLRSMSVPVAIEHAAGGSLRAGDRVDVISVVDGRGSYVAVDLEVIAVSEAAGTSIGSTSGYHVVLAVSAEDALRLAEAIDGGSLEVVRSTGAPDIEGGRVDP
jgi:Flp pilus assembly protein CpaB